MQPAISFRKLSRSDFPLLQAWLLAPHVAAWWDDRLDLLGIEAKYGPRVDGTEPIHVFLIEHRRRPIGWIQWYLWSNYPDYALHLGAESGSAGIDLAIGEVAMTGLGLGPIVIREFVLQIVFAIPDIRAVVADPEERNRRSVRAFQKAGFTLASTVRIEGEHFDRQVVRMSRQ